MWPIPINCLENHQISFKFLGTRNVWWVLVYQGALHYNMWSLICTSINNNNETSHMRDSSSSHGGNYTHCHAPCVNTNYSIQLYPAQGHRAGFVDETGTTIKV